MLWRRFYKLTLWCSYLIVSCILWASFFAPFVNAFMIINRNHPTFTAIKRKFSPEEWRPYTSSKGRFRVTVPDGYLKYRINSGLFDNHRVKIHYYQALPQDPVSYAIAYCDLPKDLQTPDFLQRYADNTISNVDGRKIQSQSLKFDNDKVIENIVQMTVPKTGEAVFSRHRFLMRKNRLYQLVVVTLTQSAFREKSDRFMNSLELITQEQANS